MVFRKGTARFCTTVGGRASFQVSGSLAEGARIWVGKSKQPLTFDREFFQRLLRELGGKGEIRIGSKFDDPGPNSLGEWIQRDQGIGMNPAVYIGGLLIDEGYAESPRRGVIRIYRERQERKDRVDAVDSADAARDAAQLKRDLLRLVERLSEEQLPRAVAAVEKVLQRGRDVSPFESLRGDPDFILPTAERANVGGFEPVRLEGRPLSQDVIDSRR